MERSIPHLPSVERFEPQGIATFTKPPRMPSSPRMWVSTRCGGPFRFARPRLHHSGGLGTMEFGFRRPWSADRESRPAGSATDGIQMASQELAIAA